MDNIEIAHLRQCAMEAAAFAVQSGCKEINGVAVIAMAAYVDTINDLDNSAARTVLGRAFDIFAAAVASEVE